MPGFTRNYSRNQFYRAMDLSSNSNNIQQTAQLILDAFRHLNKQADDVLTYEELLPYLEEHSEHQHYKDVQKDAEFHLTKEAYATPDVNGLRLTPAGFEALEQGKKA